LKAKIAGEALNEAQYGAVFDDILALRYSDRDINAFLLHASQNLSDAEVLALAKVRCKLTPRIVWDEPILVDKHSMGGAPGSRITSVASILSKECRQDPPTSSSIFLTARTPS
jgi:thymidine phosphorylase